MDKLAACRFGGRTLTTGKGAWYQSEGNLSARLYRNSKSLNILQHNNEHEGKWESTMGVETQWYVASARTPSPLPRCPQCKIGSDSAGALGRVEGSGLLREVLPPNSILRRCWYFTVLVLHSETKAKR